MFACDGTLGGLNTGHAISFIPMHQEHHSLVLKSIYSENIYGRAIDLKIRQMSVSRVTLLYRT